MPEAFDPGDKMRRWKTNLSNPHAALKQIGALMVAESQRAFKDQRFGSEEWEPRAPINVYGIIADFHAGKKSPPARRFEKRPALRDTGRLASSISFKVSGDSVTVGSNLPYAAVHQKGGPIESMPINDQVREALWKWLKGKGKSYQRDLGWLLNKKFKDETLKGEVEARPFVGITKQLREDVKEVIGAEIMEVR